MPQVCWHVMRMAGLPCQLTPLLFPHCAAAAEGKQSPLADEDKAAVREVMLEGVMRAPHAVRVQVSDIGASLKEQQLC